MATRNLSFRMFPAQHVNLIFKPVDAHGHEAPVEGVPETVISDANSFVRADISDDGKTISVHSLAIGSGDVTVTTTGDADLGEGVRPVVAVTTLTLDIVPREAADAEHEVSTEPVDDDSPEL